MSLVGTRMVTVSGRRKVGVALKMATVVVVGGLLAAHALLAPVVLAGALAVVLGAFVVAERMLIPAGEAPS